jgi:hypothetical protein
LHWETWDRPKNAGIAVLQAQHKRRFDSQEPSMNATPLAAIISAAAVLSLAACEPQPDTAPEPASDPYGLAGAAVLHEGGPALAAALTAAAGMTVATAADGRFVTLSGMPESRNSAGRTSGAAIEITGDIEEALAGRTIEIVLVARGSEGTALDAAYSTNDVGNSGWSTFVLTPEFATLTFTYETREMRSGNNDYLGLIAQNGAVDIAAIAVRPAADPQ